MNTTVTLEFFAFVCLVTFVWLRSWLHSRKQTEPITVKHSEFERQIAR